MTAPPPPRPPSSRWGSVVVLTLLLGGCGSSGSGKNGTGGVAGAAGDRGGGGSGGSAGGSGMGGGGVAGSGASGAGGLAGTGGVTGAGGLGGTGGVSGAGNWGVICTPTQPLRCPSSLCGNGKRDTCSLPTGPADCQYVSITEPCDGDDLGIATCASLGFTTGTLHCKTDCSFDTSGCSGGSGGGGGSSGRGGAGGGGGSSGGSGGAGGSSGCPSPMPSGGTGCSGNPVCHYGTAVCCGVASSAYTCTCAGGMFLCGITVECNFVCPDAGRD